MKSSTQAVLVADDDVQVMRTWNFRVFSHLRVKSSSQAVIVDDDEVQVVRT